MNMNTLIADADFDIRMFNAIKRAFPGVSTLGDLKNAMEANHNPRNFGEKTLAKVNEVLKLAETGETQLTEAPGNYMSDTSKYAYTVHAQIVLGAKMVEDGLYQMAKGFKIMRDEKLYKELGYDTFEKYCEAETGMNRRNVYKYITIVEKIPEDFVSSKAQIGKEKLLLLAALDDEQRDKITENTDLENTTVKELKRQIDELTGKNKKLFDENQELMTECDDIRNERDYFENELDDLKEEKRELELENKNLRDKPVETVTVPSDPTKSEEYKDMKERFDSLLERNYKLNAEYQNLIIERDGLEEELKEAQAGSSADGFDCEFLREFFEDSYSRANNAVRELYQFVKDGYPQEIKDHVRQRIDALKAYIENLEAIHEDDF